MPKSCSTTPKTLWSDFFEHPSTTSSWCSGPMKNFLPQKSQKNPIFHKIKIFRRKNFIVRKRLKDNKKNSHPNFCSHFDILSKFEKWLTLLGCGSKTIHLSWVQKYDFLVKFSIFLKDPKTVFLGIFTCQNRILSQFKHCIQPLCHKSPFSKNMKFRQISQKISFGQLYLQAAKLMPTLVLSFLILEAISLKNINLMIL